MILFRDSHLLAVDKPAGLLVHRTAIAAGDDDFLLQRARRLVGRRVYAVHRLDRPTSGVVLFGLTRQAAVDLGRQFEAREVEKTYLAVVRGWLPGPGRIDYPLADGADGLARPAVTDYEPLARAELPVAVGRYASSRYALLSLRPHTGRYHQIRRHLHHVHHPIIGDTTHGEGRHNRFFRERFGIARLLLHGRSLECRHPFDGRRVRIVAPLPDVWLGLLEALSWRDAVPRLEEETPLATDD